MRAQLRQYTRPIEDFCAGFRLKSPLARVLGFVGEKCFLSQDGLDYICRVWRGACPDLLQERVDLSSGNWAEKMLVVSSPGLFKVQKLFILTGLAKHKSKLQIIRSLAQNPSVGFIVLADLGRSSKALVTELEKVKALRCEVFEPRYGAFVEWLGWRSAFVQLVLTEQALRELSEWCSEDAALAVNELGKLAHIFVKKQGRLNWERIRPFLTLAGEQHVFALSDHLLEGRGGAALALCGQLADKGESQLSLLGLCIRHLYQRLTFYQEGALFESDVKLAERLPARVKESFRRRANQESLEAVCRLIAFCQQVEMDFKMGQKVMLGERLAEVVHLAADPLK